MGGGLGRGDRFPHAYPFGAVSHRGVETTLSGVALLVARRFTEKGWARASKPLCLLWLFLATYWVFRIAKERSQRDGSALAAAAGVLLYAALNPFLLRAAVSSYGICPAAGTLYHNVHQQASLAIGLGGLYLALRSLRRPTGLLEIGCALIGASLFFKPSFYAMVVPALAVGVFLARGFRLRADTLVGLGLLLACAGVWFAYPALFGIRGRWSIPVDLDFLPWHHFYVPKAIAWPTSGGVMLLLWVLVLGHASWVLPTLFAFRRWQRRPRGGGARGWIEPGAAVLLVTACSGLLSGYLLRAGQGNYMWGSAVGIVCALPLVSGGIAAIEAWAARRIAWLLYLAHLASGAWNLWLFAYYDIFLTR
jgi:hypothetical protein